MDLPVTAVAFSMRGFQPEASLMTPASGDCGISRPDTRHAGGDGYGDEFQRGEILPRPRLYNIGQQAPIPEHTTSLIIGDARPRWLGRWLWR